MENRKYLIPLIFIIAFVVPAYSYGYGYETHGYLTQETVDFYLSQGGGSLPGYLIPYLVDGARREDDSPRWLNHFFDPVYNRGFSYDERIDSVLNAGNYPSSKQWAQSSAEQNKPVYKVGSIVASILNSFQQKRLSLTTESDFTWNMALDYWARGDKERAMFALGHVLHLIQDASVPDHTRNDAHHDGSPYEQWTSKFVLGNPDPGLKQRLNTKNRIVFSDLNFHFNAIANYSNNNFYSKSTIGIQSGYQNPEPRSIMSLAGGNFGVEIDEYGEFYRLYRKIIVGGFMGESSLNVTVDNEYVSQDYWSRLSTKSVQHGAGVLDLFLQEASKREAAAQWQLPWYERVLQWMNNQANTLLGMVGQLEWPVFTITNEPSPTPFAPGLSSLPELSPSLVPSPLPSPRVLGDQIIGPGTNGALSVPGSHNIATEEVPVPSSTPEPTESPLPSESPTPEPTIEPSPTPEPTIEPSPEPTPIVIPSPTPQPIPKILDLRWGVDPESSTGYSVELLYRNMGLVDVYTPYYTGRYYLVFYLNRFQEYSYGFNTNLWQDMFLASVHADDLVKFRYPICEWGDDQLRENFQVRATETYNYCSMDFWNHRWVYRFNALPHVENPGAGIWVLKLPIAVMPKSFNDLAPSDYITAALYTTDYSDAGWTANFTQIDNRQWYFEDTYRSIMPTSTPAPAHTVVINEIAWMGTGASAYDEWIELYNGGSESVNLGGWYLRSSSGDPDIALSGSINSGEYYLLERTDDTTVNDIPADFVYTGALNNTCETVQLIDNNGTVRDEIGCADGSWYAGNNETKASMERVQWDTAGNNQSNWQTNSGVIINGLDSEDGLIFGTPRMPNSNITSL